MTVKREQTEDADSQDNTRQDRNQFLSDGGIWTWDSTNGTLVWGAAIRLWRGGLGVDIIAAGMVTGLITEGDIAYVDVNRGAAGVPSIVPGIGVNGLSAVGNATDERFIIGVVGVDGKFYMRDGTIFSDGDSKTLGTLNSVTDRNDVLADGTAGPVAVGFNYAQTTSQLAVYAGGVLQTDLTHYTETTVATITWEAGHVPSEGELISFLNIIGGEGPAASGFVTLQDALDNGRAADMAQAGGSMHLYSAAGAGIGTPLVEWGDTSNVLNALADLRSKGFIWFRGSVSAPAVRAGLIFRDSDLTDNWYLVPADAAPGDMLLFNNDAGDGLKVKKDGSGMEWGAYTGGAFPGGGSWAGDGPLRWTVVTGTLPASGAETINIPGLTSMMAVLLSVEDFDLGGGIRLGPEMGTGIFTSKQHAVLIDNANNDVIIQRSWTIADLTSSTHVVSQPYTLIIFHQG